MRALLTSNFEKSLKKNETALDFCTSVRPTGSVGLSAPLPPSIEHHSPMERGEGRLLHTTAAGVAACGEAACGQVRAPSLMPELNLMPPLSSTLDSMSTPSSPEEMTPGPLETA